MTSVVHALCQDDDSSTGEAAARRRTQRIARHHKLILCQGNFQYVTLLQNWFQHGSCFACVSYFRPRQGRGVRQSTNKVKTVLTGELTKSQVMKSVQAVSCVESESVTKRGFDCHGSTL
eukprot:5296721-Amphidinium_carterae.2